MMPDIDGHQVLRELKADKRTKDTKVVVFSALTSETDMLTAFDEETTDLDTFRVVDADVTMDFHPRHGTVIAISSEEYKRLIENWQNH